MKKNYLNTQLWILLFTLVFVSSCSGQSNTTIASGNTIESIAQTLKENNHLPVAERIALYHRLKKEDPKGYNFKNEDELTMYGYSLLWSNKVIEAIEIFKLIVEQFPNSSNPYDSLAEAYMVNGNNELAILNYEKSLELNPYNFNAEDQIERIKYPNKVAETPAEKFGKIYTPKEYKNDLDQLGKRLMEVHPETFKFTSKEAFWAIIEEKKGLITANTTYSEFRWHCSEIIASVNCSHTSMGDFFSENEMLPVSLRFPVQTRWVNNQLFVIDPLNNKNNVRLKDEIISINGIAVSKLISDIYKHIPSQGYIETTKKHFFNTWATGLIPFALDFPATYEIRVNGEESTIILNKAKAFKDPLNDESIKRCATNLCFKILGDDKSAILTISSFNYYPWNNLTVFEDFMDASFKEMAKKGVENLIIDLRFNGGGSQESSIHLLKYLVNKPFVYSTSKTDNQEPFSNSFKGQVYYLIDGEGNSTTGHFMSFVKELNLGIIIGEELGSTQFCTAGQTICRLTNTKLVYYVANSTNETMVTSLPDEIGILPDYSVTQSIDDYVNKIDAVKKFALKLIED
ncbi:MAG: S41 family peptidase [Cyclobacteriaceae bacterium]|nr:S41 family peptidase [Cyclobacteriaceae bacterium]